MHVQAGEATDARNLALVQGPASAWWVKQRSPGAPEYEVKTTSASEVRALLQRWVDEL
jgi:hypothetical protein